MKEAAALLACLSMVGAFAWYVPLIVRRRVSPAPATWIIGAMAMNLAMLSYHAIPGRTFIENATLYAAALEIVFVLAILMTILWRAGELSVAFDHVQKACLAVMVAALAWWAFNQDQSYVTFWTTQTLLVVAYLATILKALQLRTAFDSIGNWGLIFVGSVIGSVPAVAMTSPYGIANSVRPVVSSGITLSLLIWYDRLNGGARWKDEYRTLTKFYGFR